MVKPRLHLSMTCLVFLLAVGLVPRAYGEVLFFDDFENGLSQWELPETNLAGGPAGSMHTTNATAYSGAHSATFSQGTFFGDAFSRRVPVVPGQTYYLHVAHMTLGDGAFVGINMFTADDPDAFVREHWMMGAYLGTGDFGYDGQGGFFFIEPGNDVVWDYNSETGDPDALGIWKVYTAGYTIPPAIHFISIKAEDHLAYDPVNQAVFLDDIEWSTSPFPSIQVVIDIKPGSSDNPINLKSNGVIPVAVLSTGGFDATLVDGATVRFAGAAPAHGNGHLEDVDRDGDLDWICHFRGVSIQPGDTRAALTGQTLSGRRIEGSDAIRIVSGSGKGKSGKLAIPGHVETTWGAIKEGNR